MNEKVYIVLEVNWEYNDEWFTNYHGGSNPVKVWKTKKEAEDHVLVKNRSMIDESIDQSGRYRTSLGEYNGEDGDLRQHFKPDAQRVIEKRCEEAGVALEDNWEFCLSDLVDIFTEEDRVRLAAGLKGFYKVQEIEIG